MSGKTVFGLLAVPAMALAMTPPASAQTYAFPVSVRAQPLPSALQDLARQTGIELIFDRDLARSLQSPPLKGKLPVDAALRRLLDGTGLTTRRSASGAWVVERAAEGAAPDEPAIPDILVVGRRTQNVDIRRRENDIQPYQVVTGEQVVAAHRDNLDQYFRSRVTSNTVTAPLDLLANGSTNSQIDLRGLGPEGTLVLIDGRRMPSIPVSYFGFSQTDLNAIPLHAIERVETLTGTAGGIYGFGALGGVINVVLKRDYRGAELHGTSGISTRGDAKRLNVEGRIGFTPDGGRTDVMLYMGHSISQPLLQGQRDYMVRGRQLLDRFTHDSYVSSDPTGNSVGVFDLFGADLVFKPEYGGAALGSGHSYLPRGFAGTPADMARLLARNAGQLDISLTDEDARSGLTSTATTTAVIGNIRHQFGGGIEAYFDSLVLRNRGRAVDHESNGQMVLFGDSPINPFDNIVWVTFPAPTQTTPYYRNVDSERFTAGLILPLPFDWKATGEASFGSTRFRFWGARQNIYNGPLIPDGSESPDFNPFGNWDAFQQAASIPAYAINSSFLQESSNRYRDQSLRLAGPVFRTGAGVATLTLLGERRQEDALSYTTAFSNDLSGSLETYYTSVPPRFSRSSSLYAELKVPVFGERAAVPLLDGLELQLAVRHDRLDIDFIPDADAEAEMTRASFPGTAYTAGAKFFPLPWLMLRGSYATGQQPPPLDKLGYTEYDSIFSVSDPKRGGTVEDDYLLLLEGSPTLGPVRANTLSLGMVLNPLGDRAPRLSLDYSRIRRTGDYYRLDDSVVIAREDMWPERVTRAPLSDADRALGYTGGHITRIDARGINAGGVRVETLDGRLDWNLPFSAGRLHLYASATVQLRNVKLGVFEPDVEQVGFRGEPLRWRANGGMEWSAGVTTIGANLQFFSRYRIANADLLDYAYMSEEPQGSKYVKSQLYLDLHAGRRFRIHGPLGEQEIEVDLGLVNVFDQEAPYESAGSALTAQYSFYGDPRGRRFELSLSSSF